MLEWSTKIGGVHARDVGHQRVELVEVKLDRLDRRRTVDRKGRRQVGDLRERRMRVERIEGGKALFPIRQGPQHTETGCRANAPTFRIRIDRMTSRTLLARHPMSGLCISVYANSYGLLLHCARWAERHCSVVFVTRDGTLSDFGQKPISKPLGTIMVRAADIHAPSLAEPDEDRTARIAKRDICSGWIGDLFDPHLRLERKTWQNVTEQAAVDQHLGRVKPHQSVIGPKLAWQAQKKNHERAPQHGTNLGLGTPTRQSRQKDQTDE